METVTPPFFYGILRIVDCGFQVEEGFIPDLETMKIGYGMNFLFDVDNGWIDYLIRVDFRDEKTGIIFISGTVKTVFSIKDFKSHVDEHNKVVFPNGSLETLFGISFGHMRAILAKNLGGTKYSQVYVPVIDANIIFNDLLQHNIKMKTQQIENIDKMVNQTTTLEHLEDDIKKASDHINFLKAHHRELGKIPLVVKSPEEKLAGIISKKTKKAK